MLVQLIGLLFPRNFFVTSITYYIRIWITTAVKVKRFVLRYVVDIGIPEKGEKMMDTISWTADFQRDQKGIWPNYLVSLLIRRVGGSVIWPSAKMLRDSFWTSFVLYLKVLNRHVPILTYVFFTLNWLTLTPKTQFVQFYLKVPSYFLSSDKAAKVCDTGDEAVMKLQNKIKIGISKISTLFFCYNLYSKLEAEILGIIRKIWASFDTKKVLLPVERCGY